MGFESLASIRDSARDDAAALEAEAEAAACSKAGAALEAGTAGPAVREATGAEAPAGPGVPGAGVPNADEVKLLYYRNYGST